MREILFRGKHADNGEWVEGCFVKSVVKNCVYAYILTSITGDHKMVFTKTVGQFTGLQDDNGKRIFEGDIVDGLILHNLPIRAVVAFQDGAFGLDWQRGDVRVFTAFTSYCNTVFKVIGNIHDNPDLLKGE